MSSSVNTGTPQAYGVSGKHAVNITVGGNNIPIFPKADGSICLLTTQNTLQILPSIQLSVLDFFDVNSSNTPINDGTIFSVAFNDGNSGLPNPSNYRAFGSPVRHKHVSGYDELVITGILDNLSYIRETANRGIVGTSTNVGSQIASTLNMKYNTNDSSNDNMTWLAGRNTWAKYMASIAKHAYTDAKSVFSHAVDDTNTLHFINLQKAFSATTFKAVFYRGASPNDTSEPAFEIVDYYLGNSSGFLNHSAGLGMRQGQTDGTGKANINVGASASYVNGSNLDLNKNDTAKLLNRTRIQLSPMDCGNTHANFATAKHQNARLKSTYSQNLYVLVTLATGLTLYDMVRVKIYTMGNPNLTASGIYCISGIAKGIAGDAYFEKLQLTSTGPGNANVALF